MRNQSYKLGLVLSGGGARGAYEAGVTKYLAQEGLEPDMYAGASVGALNGAFLASSASIKIGAEKLESIWRSLSNDKMIQVNPSLVGLGLLYSGFLKKGNFKMARHLERNLSLYNKAASDYFEFLRKSPLKKPVEKGLLDSNSLKALIEEHVTVGQLKNGKPLWISLYESEGGFLDLLKWTASNTGLFNTKASEYIHLQSLEPDDRITALLASAALPLAYDSQTLNGISYRDGGLGEFKSSKGNTPLEPLVREGCTHAVVVHLGHGSMWDRNEYANTSIIEVRPENPLYEEGKISSLMNFSVEKIDYLIERGYEDAKRCIGNVLKSIRIHHTVEETKYQMKQSVKKLENDTSFDHWIGKL